MSDEKSPQVLPPAYSEPNKLPRATAASGLTYKERRYVKGSPASVKRLKKNGFDPIDELVLNYRRLEKELDYYEGWRAGTITPLTSEGHVKQYTANMALVHSNLYDKMVKIAEALLRYAYGRIPENLNVANRNTKPLIINLSGDQESYELYVAQSEAESDDDD